MDATQHAPSPDRVRSNTWHTVNDRLDRRAQLSLRAAASGSPGELSERLDTLDREWDFERVLESEASLMGLIGLGLGVGVHHRFLVVPGLVATMLLLHSTHGWYPLLPVFRRLSVRTRDEIDAERYGLKALRGDFTAIPAGDTPASSRAAAAWKAVCR